MKVLIHHTWRAMVLIALLLNMAACQNGASPNKQNSETDSLSIAAENKVEAAAEAGEIKRARHFLYWRSTFCVHFANLIIFYQSVKPSHHLLT